MRTKIIGGVLAVAFGVLLALMAASFLWFSMEGKTNGTLVSSGVTRKYLLYVPKTYDRAKPTPLIISLHPAASRPEAEMEISRWNEVGDEHGLLIVYPAGSDVPRVWPMGQSGLQVEVQFISDLIDKLEAEYNVDPERIYADGLSNGGGMAFALSCKLSERIAAVGAVSSAQTLSWERCGNARPVPTVAFHGTADPIVRYHGGASTLSPTPFPDILDWIAGVARRNRCQGNPSETRVAPSVRRRAYTDCAQHADVVLYTVEGGGHTWPGGGDVFPEWIVGRTNREISATRVMWEFYAQHPRVQQRDATSAK